MAAYPGTLVPGQSISVNKYTVQVERYLSQGGFAHVYLVRTATPVYNTTHHVLKRIAVSNDAMLTEVKKEVDIMRLLKGHPNIVHLIDAAWHRMPNGLYEVFILMEFCPGGGIIDMMNRRLRERLTEAEILQIFVDVLEGVAYMHNSRPPLLHRDLKVENILQSSATSFKLCDFGSATTVAARPPASMQEIRALEADLNRHTTLQYRAPEMVDPYMRRPVDEKSDVWALGVLLYKLCYYTTPFEEHGPLAILNVQYRIPPYPVYSQQMNSLIASMLREHGHQRPTVFELLNNVHRLRGTKSQFTYTIPTPQPLSPRNQTQFPPSNALESTVTYRSQQQAAQASPKNPGVQARDKVLEAIAPMRRGRPTTDTTTATKHESRSRSRTRSPQKRQPVPEKTKNWLDEEDKAWKAVQNSSTSLPKRSTLDDDAWTTRGPSASTSTPNVGTPGFGDDFAEKLWDEFDPKKGSAAAPPPVAPKPTTVPLRQPALTGSMAVNRREKDKDAFDGLGLSGGDNKPAPTLGEARLLRTGLAGMSGHSSSRDKYSGISGDYKDYKPSRPSPSPRPTFTQTTSSPGTALSPPPATQAQSQTLSPPPPALKPTNSGSSWLSRPPSSMAGPTSDGGDAAEARFPSLEELDKTFGSSTTGSNTYQPQTSSPSLPPLPPRRATPEVLRADYKPAYTLGDSGRSQPATSNAMRDPPTGRVAQPIPTPAAPSPSLESNSRPSLTRKHRSSLTMKHAYSASSDEVPMPGLPPSSSPHKSRDWLTGDDTDVDVAPSSSHSRMATTPGRMPSEQSRPVMRESPSKRASVIEKAPLHVQEASAVVQRALPLTPNTPSSPTTRAHRVFPAIDMNDEPQSTKEPESASSADEGPEEASGGFRSPKRVVTKTAPSRHKARQSSVHDLVDLYGGAGSISLPTKADPHGADDLTPRKMTFSAQAEPTTKRQTALNAIGVGRPQGRSQPTPSPTSPSAKSRPQSMFIFPSSVKPSDSASNSLAPPPEESPKPRVQMRRTSISDMVQRYESIGVAGPAANIAGGRSPVSAAPPPLASPSKSLGSSTTNPRAAENGGSGRFSTVSSTTSSSSSASLGRSIGAGALPPRVSPTGLPNRASTPQQQTTPAQQEPAPIATPRAQRPSFKSVDVGAVSSNPPSRKSTVSSEEPSPRSASPDRPYQGVGKLIDQWQRKTVETDTTTRGAPPKRGGLVAKRAGLVGKGGA